MGTCGPYHSTPMCWDLATTALGSGFQVNTPPEATHPGTPWLVSSATLPHSRSTTIVHVFAAAVVHLHCNISGHQLILKAVAPMPASSSGWPLRPLRCVPAGPTSPDKAQAVSQTALCPALPGRMLMAGDRDRNGGFVRIIP